MQANRKVLGALAGMCALENKQNDRKVGATQGDNARPYGWSLLESCVLSVLFPSCVVGRYEIPPIYTKSAPATFPIIGVDMRLSRALRLYGA